MNPDGYPSNEDNTFVDHGFAGCPGRTASPTRRPSAYTNGVVTPHAAFLALRWAPQRGDGQPREPRRPTSPSTTSGASATRSTSTRASSRTATCRSTRGSSWPRSATRSATTCCATRSRRRRSRRRSSRSSGWRRFGADAGPNPVAPALAVAPRDAAASACHRRRRRAARPGSPGSRRSAPRSERDRPAPAVSLPPPDDVRAVRGRGQVTIDWSPVEGAAGYLVHRGPSRRRAVRGDRPGRWRRAGRAARPVPRHDRRATGAWYAVSSVATIEAPAGRLSEPVAPAPGQADGRGRHRRRRRSGDGRVSTAVAADHRLGASRPAVARRRPRRPRRGRGARRGVPHRPTRARHRDGPGPRHPPRFARASTGKRPMEPSTTSAGSTRSLRPPARDRAAARRRAVVHAARRWPAIRTQTCSTTSGSSRRRATWERWAALVRRPRRAPGRPVRPRRGRAAGRSRSGTRPTCASSGPARESEYCALYDATRRGPSRRSIRASGSAARRRPRPAGSTTCSSTAAPTGAADRLRLDPHLRHAAARPAPDHCARYGRSDLPLWWTEWGVSPTHGAPVNDGVWAAPLVRARHAFGGRPARCARRTGWPPTISSSWAGRRALFHGGFGLLTDRQPAQAALLGARACSSGSAATSSPSRVDGDGAGSLVEAWASRDDDGRVAIAVWNGTLDQSKADGDAPLDRTVTLEVDGLAADGLRAPPPPGRPRPLEHPRDLGGAGPARTGRIDDGWARLREADRLETIGDPQRIRLDGGRATLEVELPMPAVSLIELIPVD